MVTLHSQAERRARELACELAYQLDVLMAQLEIVARKDPEWARACRNVRLLTLQFGVYAQQAGWVCFAERDGVLP